VSASKRPEFPAFLNVIDIFLADSPNMCHNAFQGVDGAAERAKLSEEDMEKRKVAIRRARGVAREPDRQKKKRPGGSAQVLDNARFGQGESKPFL
jgi:hypothetical protein